MTVAFDLRPISFTDHQEGLSQLVEAVFRAGQATPVNDMIDTKSLMACSKTVAMALSTLADANRRNFKTALPEMVKTDGAVTTDGVTLTVQDKLFYDLTLHYIDMPGWTPFQPTPKFRMCCKTLLLQEKKDESGAEQIRNMLGDAWQNQYGFDLDRLTEGFTMVTDNASVMARVARASVSTRIAPLTQKWMGCLVHQINTALKCCMQELANHNDLSAVFEDVQAVKKIVRIFKQSNWNALLPHGHKLIQEVETRFGTTFQVLQRFLKSSVMVEDIFSAKDSAPAKASFASLTRVFDSSGITLFPALEAVIDSFGSAIELQTALQASNHPTIHVAIPKFKRCTDKLQTIVDGGSVSRGSEIGFIPAPRLSRMMCKSTIEWLEAKIRVHPLLMAGCYMNPLFREFQFLEDIVKRKAYKTGAEAMVRAMIEQPGSGGQASPTVQSGFSSGNSLRDCDSGNEPAVAGRKRTFSLLEYADSHFQPTEAVDDVSRYNFMDISQLPIDRSKYMKDEFAALRFWHMHRSSYSDMYKVALRLYAIPVSSCASERVFSAVNRIVTRDRASTGSKTLEDIVVLRSLASEK